MKASRQQIVEYAKQANFRPEIVEKVVHLIELLGALDSHQDLRGMWVLKGGTALNLFWYQLPRLSVDIDLNMVGIADLAELTEAKPRLLAAAKAVFSRAGYTIAHEPTQHAGGKWVLRYPGAFTQNSNLEVDMNFQLRVPLWQPGIRDSVTVAGLSAEKIRVLDLHEIAGGKLAALLSRTLARDVFDSVALLEDQTLEDEKLRIAFVVYGAMSKVDWRQVRAEVVKADRREFANSLVPVLHSNGPSVFGTCDDMVQRARAGLDRVLPLRAHEIQFLDAILDRGTIEPELLTTDADLQQRIASHPALRWKAMNVRKHRGLPEL